MATTLLRTLLKGKSCGIRQVHSVNYSYPQSLLNVPETRVTTLSNGLRVASERTNAETATVGIWIDAGSRYETMETNGVAHFLEHLTFKGTPRHTQKDLELEFENMGGHLNAYTSREQTVYFAKVLKKDVPKAVDIIADILQHSNLDPQHIERERGVILREMEEVEKQTQEVIFDHLHAIAYQGHSLGRTILGPVQNIRTIHRDQLTHYVRSNYIAPRMVLAAAGAIDHDALVKMAESAFSQLPSKTNPDLPSLPAESLGKARFTGSDVRVRNDEMEQLHCAIAVEGVGWTHPDFFPLMVAQSFMGAWDRSLGSGPNTSSALARALQSNDLADAYMSFNSCYKDTGLYGVYFVTSTPPNADDVFYHIQKEWMRLCTQLADHEVHRAKQQLKTSMLLQLDGTTAIAEDIGRQLLTYGRRMTPYEIDQHIEAVDTAQVRQVASKYLYDKCIAVAAVGPTEAIPDYNRLRSGMSWLRF